MTVLRAERHLALAMGILFSSGVSIAAEMTIMKEDYGQFHYKTDRLGQPQSADATDVTTRRVRQILDRVDVDYRIQLRTWPISYRRASNRSDYGIFPLEKTPDQMNTFEFVGPLATYNWVVYTRPNSDLRIDSLKDLEGLDIGGYQNSSFTRYLTEQGIEVDELPFDALNLKKLTLGYIDAWVTYNVNAESIAREAQYPMPRAAWVVKSVDVYLGINRETDTDLLSAIVNASSGPLVRSTD
ncbi:substrate-binding periplasmic protein [Saccharospirillum salsuginis]|uniref:Solute-binding protein family 3/N-terminal domain-containing protein n=1 Tax=Saccharospirillum salsuginis TaxID=418750 RepID=A0A918KAD4_9GAMM|nr:transporter substrate-binding domain-containing protein [Saccharospirillum salsuginis]GGX54785.1 hypothetical protein GCM10007392_22810 [Saccharospirillum salsuginis]